MCQDLIDLVNLDYELVDNIRPNDSEFEEWYAFWQLTIPVSNNLEEIFQEIEHLKKRLKSIGLCLNFTNSYNKINIKISNE